MLRLHPIALPLLVLPLVGCNGDRFVQTQQEGERLIFTQHWSLCAIFVVIGLAVLSLGVPMLTGRLKSKGKTRVAGLLFTLIGLVFSIGPLLTAPYSYVALDRESLYIQGGLFGTSKMSVDLKDVKEVDIHQVRRSGGSRKRRKRRRIAIVTFVPRHGDPTTVNMSSDTRAAALKHLIELAPELGIEIDDGSSIDQVAR